MSGRKRTVPFWDANGVDTGRVGGCYRRPGKDDRLATDGGRDVRWMDYREFVKERRERQAIEAVDRGKRERETLEVTGT